MTDYEKWLEMARDSFAAADGAKCGGHLRSAASRYYYAAYQAATALFLYRGLTPPALREAWSHDETPEIMLNDLSPLIRSRYTRSDLSARLDDLYNLRVTADYKASRTVDSDNVEKARKDAGFILSRAEKILPKEKPK